MKKTLIAGTAGVAIAAMMIAFGNFGGWKVPSSALAQTGALQGMERQQIETIVRDYLIANPEILLDVQDALERKQDEARKEAQVQIIAEASDTLFNADYDGIAGNPEGSATVVEFFDYNCGYCKRALADMEAMTAADPELRFVLKELPILGPDSQQAHVVSMAFHALHPEKYAAFHSALLGSADRATEASAMALAIELGADEAALRKEMENPAIMEAFGETYELANKLSITGTPSYVIGDEVVFGALGQKVLEEKVALTRSN